MCAKANIELLLLLLFCLLRSPMYVYTVLPIEIFAFDRVLNFKCLVLVGFYTNKQRVTISFSSSPILLLFFCMEFFRVFFYYFYITVESTEKPKIQQFFFCGFLFYLQQKYATFAWNFFQLREMRYHNIYVTYTICINSYIIQHKHLKNQIENYVNVYLYCI